MKNKKKLNYKKKSGGSTQEMRSILNELHQLDEMGSQHLKTENELSNLEDQLNQYQRLSNTYYSCNQKLELSKHAMLLLRKKIETTSAHQLIESVSLLENSISESKERLNVVTQSITTLEEKIEQIEERIVNFF